SEHRFRTLFEHMPVAIVEADFTAVGRRFADWRTGGVSALQPHLDATPAALGELVEAVRVVHANETARRLLGTQAAVESGWSAVAMATDSSQAALRAMFLALWDG